MKKNMLLTKFDLLSLIDDRIIYHRDGGDEEETKYWSEIRDALGNDSLDIAGYDKNEWVRLNPDDPTTFPPSLTKVLVALKNQQVQEVFAWGQGKFSLLDACDITHWRPLPLHP